MIILTGGAGFIGSAFLWKLNEKSITDVVVVDEKDAPGKEDNLKNKTVPSNESNVTWGLRGWANSFHFLPRRLSLVCRVSLARSR